MKTTDTDQFILDNIPLINVMIKELHCQYKTDDEYQQYYDAGLEGLIRGAQTYNESKGKPSTYLCTCIKNMITRTFYLNSQPKRNNPAGRDISLNYELYDDSRFDYTEYGELIPDPNVNIENEVEKQLEKEKLLNAINNLKNEKDKLAIKMYYGLDGYPELGSYDEVAKKFGVTREMIRIRIYRAKNKLKEYLSKHDEDVFAKNKQCKKEDIMEEKIVSPLEQINIVLLEQLNRLRNLDTNDSKKSQIEIARSNAIATTSKTILQSIGIGIMIDKAQHNLPMIESKCQKVE